MELIVEEIHAPHDDDFGEHLHMLRNHTFRGKEPNSFVHSYVPASKKKRKEDDSSDKFRGIMEYHGYKKERQTEAGREDYTRTEPGKHHRVTARFNDEDGLDGIQHHERFTEVNEDRLDELSKKKLGNYIKAASQDNVETAAHTTRHLQTRTGRTKRGKKKDLNAAYDRYGKRERGIRMAVDRLTKEEFEVNEDKDWRKRIRTVRHPSDPGKFVNVYVPTREDEEEDERDRQRERKKKVNEDAKFPALRGKTKQDFAGEVSNGGLKANEPFGKKLRDIVPKKQKFEDDEAHVNRHSDGDWQETNGLSKIASMNNIIKWPQHIASGVDDEEPFTAVKIKSGKDGRMLAPDVGFKNAPEHVKKMKGVNESRHANPGDDSSEAESVHKKLHGHWLTHPVKWTPHLMKGPKGTLHAMVQHSDGSQSSVDNHRAADRLIGESLEEGSFRVNRTVGIKKADEREED